VGVAYPMSLRYLHVDILNVIALIAWAVGVALIVTTSRYRPRPTASTELSLIH
jgi:hypothetical protein